jgi:hypothetical protein
MDTSKKYNGRIKKGEHRSPKTEFTTERVVGKRNCNWKGEKVGYFALHTWVKRNYGRPTQCVDCGSARLVQWANISKEYRRERIDWKQLCIVCHKKFDGKTKLDREQAHEVKRLYGLGLTQVAIAKVFNVHQVTISHIVNGKIKYYA